MTLICPVVRGYFCAKLKAAGRETGRVTYSSDVERRVANIKQSVRNMPWVAVERNSSDCSMH